jgi:hypothetical protein
MQQFVEQSANHANDFLVTMISHNATTPPTHHFSFCCAVVVETQKSRNLLARTGTAIAQISGA